MGRELCVKLVTGSIIVVGYASVFNKKKKKEKKERKRLSNKRKDD
jgi:hypothetical protein